MFKLWNFRPLNESLLEEQQGNQMDCPEFTLRMKNAKTFAIFLRNKNEERIFVVVTFIRSGMDGTLVVVFEISLSLLLIRLLPTNHYD